MKLELAGVDSVIRDLGTLPRKIMRKGVAGGVKAVGREGVKDLKAAVPTQTGVLRRSIGAKVLKKRGDEIAALKIGGTRKVARAGVAKPRKQDYILRFLEGGVKRHILMAWGADNKRYGTQAVRKMNKSGTRPARALYHKGFRGRWLLRQLMATHNRKYAERFAAGVTAAVAKARAA